MIRAFHLIVLAGDFARIICVVGPAEECRSEIDRGQRRFRPTDAVKRVMGICGEGGVARIPCGGRGRMGGLGP